jgi:hypothetical protein
MAPPAGEGAALEENRGADALAVMNGISLDIKNQWHTHKLFPQFHIYEFLCSYFTAFSLLVNHRI